MAIKARVLDLALCLPTSDEASTSIVVTQGLAPDAVIRTVADHGVKHLVQKDGLLFDAELEAATGIIQNPMEYFNDPARMILGKDLDTKLSSFLSIVKAGEKKQKTMANFEQFLMAQAGTKTIFESSMMIADELFTNGNKNAWPKGVSPFTAPPEIDGQVEFFAEAVAGRLLIGCRDSFGNLKIDNIMDRLVSCYSNGVAQSIRHGNAGAGIGSYMVFEACASYYAGVENGKRSVVCILLPLGMGRRQASGLSKNIHLLSIENDKTDKTPSIKPRQLKGVPNE